MHTVANHLRHPVRLLLAALLLMVLPFIGMVPRAVAMDEHAMDMADVSMDCAAACARTALPAPGVVLKEKEDQLPDPQSQESVPYHQQFTVLLATAVLKPAAPYGSSLARPPDIVKLSGNFRL